MFYVINGFILLFSIIFAYKKGKEKASKQFLKAVNEAEYNNEAKPKTIEEFVEILIKYL